MKTNVWTVRGILPAVALISALIVGCNRSSSEATKSAEATTNHASKSMPGGGNSTNEADASTAQGGSTWWHYGFAGAR